MKFKPLDEEKKANSLQQINTVVSEVEDNETYSLNEDEQKVIANALHKFIHLRFLKFHQRKKQDTNLLLKVILKKQKCMQIL